MAQPKRVKVITSDADRARYQLWMRRGVNDAFTVARRKLRAAIMASPSGTWDTASLWDATWWTDAVDKDIAPVLWRIYWSSAQRIADAAGTDVMNSRTTIETRWRTQVNRIYGYADTVGNRVGELAVEGDGESRGWMLDRVGLVAAAGPLSDGIDSNMTDSESVGAAQGGEGAPMFPLYWLGAAFVPVRDGVRRSLRKAKVLR